MRSKGQKHHQSLPDADNRHGRSSDAAEHQEHHPARPDIRRLARGASGGLPGLQRAVGNRAVGRLLAEVARGQSAVQRLHSRDYQRAQLNANGRTDMQNVVDGLTAAIRGNLAGLDENGYWQHIRDHNHNARPVVGNASSFGGATQATVRGYINHVLNNYTPVLQDSQLVYEGNGAICNGIHRDGDRQGVRVMLSVADLTDQQSWANQIGSIQIVNAYPI